MTKMGKHINLIGKRFGRWVVLSRAENGKRRGTRWLCQCSCKDKTERIIYTNQLLSGDTNSCGCINRERLHNRLINLTGKKFNRWIILKRVGSNKWGDSTWLCQCSCKDKIEKIICGSDLRRGSSTSCGCFRKEKSRENVIDLLGKTFGK